jgi:hypothetical protein
MTWNLSRGMIYGIISKAKTNYIMIVTMIREDNISITVFGSANFAIR